MMDIISTNGIVFVSAFWLANFVLACVIITLRDFFQ